MRHSFQTVKFAFWNVLTFQLAYKLLAAIVFVPLFGIILISYCILVVMQMRQMMNY